MNIKDVANKDFFSTSKTKEKLEGIHWPLIILLPSNFSFVLATSGKKSLLHRELVQNNREYNRLFNTKNKFDKCVGFLKVSYSWFR